MVRDRLWLKFMSSSDPVLLREAWNKLGKMTKEEARKEYIKQLTSLSAKWKEWKGGKAKL